MQKKLIGGFFLFFSCPLLAQRGDELLVYSVKGNVTAVYKKQESPVKIGKVLLPGAVIKTKKDASLTMLCSRGKALSLTKQGNFPVLKWKDSCRQGTASVTSNYFKYIWDQLYSYSPEHAAEIRRRSDMAVARGEPLSNFKPKKFTKLEFSPGLDTVHYDGNPFPLSWTGSGYTGFYQFSLYNAKGDTLLFRDSLRGNFIMIDSMKHLLVPGASYRWTVLAAGAPVSKKRTLNYVPAEVTAGLTAAFLQPLPIPEDTATTFFRVAYLLEKRHFFAAAYNWYKQAALQNNGMELFRDQLIRFRNEYWIRY